MFVEPMLLVKEFEPFDDNNYLAELKLDGIRGILSSIKESKVYIRHNTDITTRFSRDIASRTTQGNYSRWRNNPLR